MYDVDNVCRTAEDAVDPGDSKQEPSDDVVEMSGRCWSSRSGQSSSATGRRQGPRGFSRRDTPRHVHIYKHDRGLMFRRLIAAVYCAIIT